MWFWKPFLAWSALGLIGVVFVALSVDLAMLAANPAMSDMSPAALRVLAALQPALLMLIGTALGVHLADGLGFRSWLTSKLRGETIPFPAPLLPLVLGLAVGFGVAVADVAFLSMISEDMARPAQFSPMDRLAALTYGAIAEELIMRYGLLSLFVWMLTAPFKRALPHPLVVWVMITFVAVLFGAGHLPAMAQLTELTGPIIARTIALNAALGIVVGWLLWKRGLEASVMAHFAFHPGLWLGLALVA